LDGEIRSYREAKQALGKLIATGVVPPRSEYAAYLLRPTKRIREARLDRIAASLVDEIDGLGNEWA
jgi:hypothetical protein